MALNPERGRHQSKVSRSTSYRSHNNGRGWLARPYDHGPGRPRVARNDEDLFAYQASSVESGGGSLAAPLPNNSIKGGNGQLKAKAQTETQKRACLRAAVLSMPYCRPAALLSHRLPAM